MVRSNILVKFLEMLKNGEISEEDYRNVINTIIPSGKVDDTMDIMTSIINKKER